MTTAAMSDPAPRFECIAIYGVGLIGGSLAGAIRQTGIARQVIGVGREPSRLRPLVDKGWLEDVTAEGRVAAAAADLLIFCTPVDRIAAGIRDVASACRPGTLITDAGSVKQPLCREIAPFPAPRVAFVGSHPLAGSEKRGSDAADDKLFLGKVCVVTPNESTDPAATQQIERFWQLLGMRVLQMSPAAHDQALALTSHLPHWLAATLAHLMDDAHRPLAASGFRDTTRIAAGDPELWTAIFLANRDALLGILDRHAHILAEYRAALERADASRLTALLQQAKQQRDALSLP